ncbi:MAG: hypothetical protein ACK5P5_07335 [Pseudobdellovibrionaceae bacterium]
MKKTRATFRSLLVAFVALFLFQCQTVPKPLEEYALARAALDAAKLVEAARYSPGSWNQAEESYRRARLFFREQDWENAKIYFTRARLAAEKAEIAARVTRMKSGEIL